MRRADANLGLRLLVLSLVVILTVGLWTRGDSQVLAVEARLEAVRALAQENALPLPALVASLVGEAYRPTALRKDAEVAAELAGHLRTHGGDVAAALAAFAEDQGEERRIVDLWRRMRERWRRLAGQ
ncbi:MAG: hypothetical protein CSA62_09695 [Planctomycetota bacterium]|nr:MAG: hypothetical protein CSA62_09695 [Planctomycetota bacterium]